jgi:hypothetical protein
MVARTLGHSSVRVGEESYLTPGIVDDARGRELELRLMDNKKWETMQLTSFPIHGNQLFGLPN